MIIFFNVQTFDSKWKKIWKEKIKDTNVKNKLTLKKIIKYTFDQQSKPEELINKLSKWDHRTYAQVLKADWFSTRFLPFSLIMVKLLFIYIKSKLNLKPKFEIIYNKKQAEADAIYQDLDLNYNKMAVSLAICAEVRRIATTGFDPRQFAEKVKSNSGSPIHGINVIKNNFNNNNNNNSFKNRKRKRKNSYFNPTIPPEKCRFCKDPTKPCRNNSHNLHWAKKYQEMNPQ